MKPAQAPTQNLLRLAWPIFAEQLLHMATGVADTWMISRISDEAAAGVGSAWLIVFMFMMAFNVLAIGASIVTTHHLGRGDREGARRLTRGALTINLWLGVGLSLLLAWQAERLLGWQQLTPPLMQYALPFLQLMGGTLFLESINLALGAALRAHGKTRAVMWVFVAQNAVNVISNAVLIFGLFGAPQLGVVGVALSTVLSRLVASAALWWLARRHIGLRLPWMGIWQVPREDLRRLLSFGLPAVLENISWFGAYMLLTALTARMGARELATQTYVMQIANVVMLLSISIGLANEILIGHLVGAGRLDEAYTQCLRHMKQGFVGTLLVALVVAGFAPWLVARFTSDAHIIALGVPLVMMGILVEPGRSFNLIMINALRAAGDVRFPVAAGTLSQWGVMAFGAWLLGTVLGFGLVGVWCAVVLDEWLRGLLMLQRWRSRKWELSARRAGEHCEQLPLSLSASGTAGMT